MINYYTTLNSAYIYSTIEEFMEHNSPCKNCLIQTMCISIKYQIKYKIEYSAPYMRIRYCENLNTFLVDNESFSDVRKIGIEIA